MRFSSAKARRKPGINVVPLLDILAIILIFMVVTTVFKKEEPIIKLQLPESGQAKPAEENPPAIIYVTKNKEVFLDSQPVQIEELPARLTAMAQERGQDFFVALKSDTDAPMGLFLKISEAAEQAGFRDLPVFTDPESGQAQP
ncbi:MAG: biopolymer transporter ExbD [Verrucomicrobiota bacterium]